MIGTHYEIIEEVGAGGMGRVYRGVDTDTRQTVAIKQLKAEVSTPKIIERFRREGEALRDLNHPNIVKLLDTVEHDGQHYLIMEYISGGDLNKLLEQGQLSISRILKLSIDLVDALTRAHKLNIVHRDLKPGNVLIGDDGILRLTDFGVAYIGDKERVTGTNAMVGTIDYLPPEAFISSDLDVRSDIWAFGVMLFEMLSGRRPFSGESIVQVIHNITSESAPDLEELRPDVPPALIDLVYRMLQKDRNHRVSSARIVGAELEAMLLGTVNENTPITIDFEPGRFMDSTPVTTPANHNLPIQTTPFVGREPELAEIGKLLEDPTLRLISIIAPGGMGKTRLSLEVAERLSQSFDDGVRLVELAPLTDPDQIVTAIAEAIDVHFEPGPVPPNVQLVKHLAEKDMLLVLDNFEHVLDGVGIISAILKDAQRVQILATSRVKLNLSGETVYNLGGMDFPDWETPEDALQYSAVNLFMQSARRAQPGFELQEADLNFVARICRLVQGLPLGILLAAAWLDTLSVEEIAGEIAESADILETELRDVPERQRSIRAVFEYSWHLLNEKEQTIFAQLSVFKNGFTREAAQKVTGANLRNLNSLVNKSLVQRNNDTGRYLLHELLRQYAEEALKDVGQFETTSDAHAQYFVNFLVGYMSDYQHFQLNVKTINAEWDNLRAAWTWLVDQGDAESQSVFVLPMYFFTRSIQRDYDGVKLFQYARQRFEVPIEQATTPLQRMLWVHYVDREPDSQERLERAIPILEADEDWDLLIYSVFGLGVFGTITGRYEIALNHLERALTIIDETGSHYVPRGVVMMNLIYAYALNDQFDEALAMADTIIKTRPAGLLHVVIIAHSWTMYLKLASSFVTGDFASVHAEMNTIRDLTMQLNDRVRQTRMMAYEGLLALQNGEPNRAQSIATHILSVSHESYLEDSRRRAYILLGDIALSQQEFDTARKHYTTAAPLMPSPIDSQELAWRQAILALLDEDVENARQALSQHLRESVTIPARFSQKFGEAAYFGKAFLHMLAAIQAQAGELETAAMLLGKIANRPHDNHHWAEDLPIFTDLPGHLSAGLGADAYQQALEHGQSMDLMAVIPDLLSS